MLDKMHNVLRTCTRHSKKGRIPERPLTEYRSAPAYVLLGDPGVGKTTVFRQEANASSACHYVAARDLITFDDRPEWHGKTLFIDGLDEVRAGSADARTPFDFIRARLDQLGRPPFRLSCREADWFGASDREYLEKVAPEGAEILELHLDPLTDNQIEEILTHDERVTDPRALIEEAENRGLIDLMRNPQVLALMMAAVAQDGTWPKSRNETFAYACSALIREYNREHRDAGRNEPAAMEEQLDAAGLLCAILLIAGKAGYSLSPATVEESYPSIYNIHDNNLALRQRVLKTKLFTGSAERATPIHRSVAEYLGGRYLSKLIENNRIPVSRVLALLTGQDSMVVSDLRGLFAWLVTLCHREREVLIQHDPLGIVLYGDVRDFSVADKRRILDGLRKEAKRYEGFRSVSWHEQPFGALCSQDMETVFRELLVMPDRSDAHQAIVHCILDGMFHGEPLPGLYDAVLKVVQDTSYSGGIRKQALRVFIRLTKNDKKRTESLLRLLADIKVNNVPDPDDELLGCLLDELYPDHIGPSAVFNYLHVPKNSNLLGLYVFFWIYKLPERSSEAMVIELLDQLVKRQDELMPVLDEFHFRSMISKLLVRGLEACQDAPDVERLYHWLGLGLDRHRMPRWGYENEEGREVTNWLENRPEIQKAIIKLSLDLCANSDRFDICVFEATQRLFNAQRPSDYGIWCLHSAKKAPHEMEAKYLLREAVGVLSLPDFSGGLTLEILQQAAQEQPRLEPWLQELLWCPIDPRRQQSSIDYRRMRQEREHKKREWIQIFKSHQSDIMAGTAPPMLLDHLASAYFGYFIDASGDTPSKRLDDFLNGDQELVQATLTGFRNCVNREDVPDVARIIYLHRENQRHLLARPFRAGVGEISHRAPQQISELREDQIRKALAFHFTEAVGQEPDWYVQMVRNRADLVADVLIQYGIAMVHAGGHVSGLYALAHDESHSQVASKAALPLLTAFPVRCTTKQLESLKYLLKAALRHADHRKLFSLIEEKLTKKSMNVAQRVRWIATGLIADPDKYEQRLDEYLQGSASRIRHLARFLSHRFHRWSLHDSLPDTTLGLLIRQLGRHYPPYEIKKSGWVSPAMEAADLVNALIARLEAIPSEQATQEIEKLLRTDGLSQWYKALRRALYHQLARRREANFLHPSVDQVNQALQNHQPVNAADLAALTLDHIRGLAEKIRNANTDDYKQYWNLDKHGRPRERKHEEACRDAFLSDLRERLAPIGIDAQPEGHYSEDKKADIRVSVGGTDGFNVPIEIKCNDHRDVWRAIHTQLISKYTRDPGACGYGIYLVFWFGQKYTTPPPQGRGPRSAAELEARLKNTLKTRQERWQISVCVIDCSAPEQRTDMLNHSKGFHVSETKVE